MYYATDNLCETNLIGENNLMNFAFFFDTISNKWHGVLLQDQVGSIKGYCQIKSMWQLSTSFMISDSGFVYISTNVIVHT